MTRRRWLAAAAALAAGPLAAQVPEWSRAAQARLLGPAGADERQRLVRQAEAWLAQGDAAAAERAFDEAAGTLHSADVEAGLVRSYMQQGGYRRALAFAAHAAGAHREVPGGMALYAWLLNAGGQTNVARRLLGDALASFPDDPLLRLADEQLRQPWPLARGGLLDLPLRCAPQPWGAAVPASAACVGTAVLAQDGQRALVPSASLRGARSLWVRNGLGQAVAAQAEPVADGSRWAVLRLAAALPAAAGLVASPRPPFAGSPGSLVEYAGSEQPQAAWPLLRQGFLGRQPASAPERLLGIDTAPGPRGGPVFDAAGRLAGVALPGRNGADLLAAVDALPLPLVPAPETAAPAATVPLDTVYEQALRVALQLLVVSSSPSA